MRCEVALGYRVVLGLPLLLIVLAGCGGGDPYPVVPVSGKLTYEDGSLVPGPRITLMFVPQVEAIDLKTSAKEGTTVVNVADGTFSWVTTYKPGDGLIPGEHKVVVKAFNDDEVPTPGVKPEYREESTTTLRATVSAGMGPLELKIAKP